LTTGVASGSGSMIMSSSRTRGKSARIEATSSGEWRLVTEGDPPHLFSADGLVAMLGEADARRKKMSEMEKKLDDLSALLDE
jgi:hypothetical protein